MSPSEKAKLVLFVALLLLCLSGIATAFTIIRLHTNESWVRHTYDVEVALGDEESALADVGRHRVAYVDSGTPETLEAFWKATAAVPVVLARVRQLTADNPAQQPLLERLESNASARVAPSIKAVALKQQNQSDPYKEMQLTTEVATAASETAAISQAMRQSEDNLLEQRSRVSGLLFTITLWILALSFVSSALMFGIHYRLLSRELRERRAAEDHLHQLSGQLMRVQDEERRRLSRELHDGLGQNLVAAKMAADALVGKYRGEPRLSELAAVLSDSLSQTRTISYLLHPPLLDEIGFASAARWFIEGYRKRTGTAVSADIPAEIVRLPRTLELVLFRILQEALTNIHRHTKSATAEVSVCLAPDEITLVVRDYGQGIPGETLANFGNGTHAGVGLAGMKERVRELGGKLEIRSQSSGTEIAVRLPMAAEMQTYAPSPLTPE